MKDLFSQEEDFTSYTGTLERVIFENPATSYTVARFRPEKGQGSFVVVGNLRGAQEGERLRLKGKWVYHERFGEQFQVTSCELLSFLSVDGIARYLAANVEGIGEKMAERIVQHFGTATWQVLWEEPERLAQVPGIGKKRIQAIVEKLEKRKGEEATRLFLHSLGLRGNLLEAILDRYGREAESKIRQNPYCLVEFRGVGFKKADFVAKQLGVDKDSPFRARAALAYTLEKALEQGSTCLPEEELLTQAEKISEIPRKKLKTALWEGVEEKEFLVDWEDAVYLPPLWFMEEKTARKVKDMLKTVLPLSWKPERLEPRYTEEQKKAIEKALGAKLFLLTGGPGVGKTYTVSGLVHLLQAKGKRVALASPTGRAAKRLEQLTGCEAKTLHRLLRYQPGQGFLHNRRHPLEVDTVIVDEASMLDIFLFSHLLDALEPCTQLILVGDPDQLPPVGPGRPFWDLLQFPAVPSARLENIFRQRQGSQIIQNAHRVRRGEMPELKNLPNSDFYFLRERSPERICDMLVELIQHRLPRRFAFSPEDIQVITPMRRGKLGYERLNQILQQAFNPSGRALGEVGSHTLRSGDKVMQVQNNYDKEVFNGDIGYVIGEENQKILVRFDDRVVSYRKSELDELSLAYAISVHKSQGSEYPCVILPLLSEHYVLLRRNLLYTAITRGKKLVLIIGDPKAVALAVRRVSKETRHSHLRDFLTRFWKE